VLSSNPGRIGAEIPIPLARPRDRLDGGFASIVDSVYAVLTARTVASIGAFKQARGGAGQPLPHASVNRMNGLITVIAAPPYSGRAELDSLTSALSLKVNELFAIAEGLHILEFAELKEGALKLTAAGQVFAHSGTDERKGLFREHLLRFVPLAAHICRVLHEREGQSAPRLRFEMELEDYMNRREAEKTLGTATAWARYAELFSYDDKTRLFSLLPQLSHG
jgi:NitT/TauT family transport system ATP-binding protein